MRGRSNSQEIHLTEVEKARITLHRTNVDWLAQFEWDWLVTLTFENAPGSIQADKRFDRLIDVINRKLYRSNYRKRGEGIYWAKVLERHRKGDWHIHALLGDTGNLRNRLDPTFVRDSWRERDGFSNIQPIIDRRKTVISYVVKHAHEDGIDASATLKNVKRIDDLI